MSDAFAQRQVGSLVGKRLPGEPNHCLNLTCLHTAPSQLLQRSSRYSSEMETETQTYEPLTILIKHFINPGKK